MASVEEQKSSVEEETTVVNETTINQEETVTVMEQESLQATTEQQEVEHHPTNDEIEEYEESQRKFRELWEKKREKVSFMMIFLFTPFSLHSPPPFILFCKFTDDEFFSVRVGDCYKFTPFNKNDDMAKSYEKKKYKISKSVLFLCGSKSLF